LVVTQIRSTAEAQPGGRDTAPGALALVQSFLNTRWNLDRDLEEQLDSPEALARWLKQHDLLERGRALRQAELKRALDVREGLRALLFVNNGGKADRAAIDRLDRALGRLTLGIELGAGEGPGLVPRGSGLDGALASMASIVAVARVNGTWERLKACPGRHCGWAFYDHSRNRSGCWCSMAVCGSREKARDYRRRKRVRGS
jgi:predicted RNA-binding Zn ribbon-like protein